MAMNNDNNSNSAESKTCVVLGGRGFIGRSLVESLLKLGNWIVRVADSTQSIELDDSSVSDSLLFQALASGRASYFHVDVRNKEQIIRAVEGAAAVFYTDALDSFIHDFYFFYTIVVQGTRNVISACQQCKVKHLIYNSPADVVFESAHDLHSGDESLPYVGKFCNMLTDLKAQAEALVLFANNIDGLLTCVICHSNVFGPGDKNLVPLLIDLAKSCWAKFIIGTGENMSDFTYVENVAHANIRAEGALNSRMGSVSGKVFFITNLEPLKFWDFASLLLDGLGYQRPPMIKLPALMVKHIVSLLELMHLKIDCTSVRRILELSSCTRTFNCSAAQKHIGYLPVVSLEEGVAMTVESFSHLVQHSIFPRYGNYSGESKANKFLGNGKVADILLWRDERKTFTCFLSLVLLYYWFFLCGRTLVSSAAKLLLLTTILLAGHSVLPSTISGFTIPRAPLSSFEISEAEARGSVSIIAYVWNQVYHLTEALAQGNDWCTFLMMIASLYFLKVVVSHSLIAAIGIVLVLAFTVFYIYEQYEDEIDGAAKSFSTNARNAFGWFLTNLPSALALLLSYRGAL